MPNALPTLNVNQPIIDDPTQIMIALLKFLFWNPGWTSSQIEDELLSMRKFRAQTGQEINDMKSTLQTCLNDAVQRYRNDWKASVDHEILSPTTYRLKIAITDNVGVPVINMNDIVVKDGEIMLKSDLKEIDDAGY